MLRPAAFEQHYAKLGTVAESLPAETAWSNGKKQSAEGVAEVARATNRLWRKTTLLRRHLNPFGRYFGLAPDTFI